MMNGSMLRLTGNRCHLSILTGGLSLVHPTQVFELVKELALANSPTSRGFGPLEKMEVGITWSRGCCQPRHFPSSEGYFYKTVLPIDRFRISIGRSSLRTRVAGMGAQNSFRQSLSSRILVASSTRSPTSMIAGNVVNFASQAIRCFLGIRSARLL